ncbi:2-amino-4-hydroxy-6-hydroxymethyldihydropteridine diphosphokinase [Anaerophilus nitritogenes]|uniref:2-amino-4-hydroxy-6- hydroxymethyldihydropteridine diphosphokinase n=1 Tax=Anaerophilus nitritogenes TaxID=2498136 RepID=UPI00101B6243|nr:2-amino-4-hydroxy-6-hydroxymethyldihydropteridine diphosphokinase [Anaerophilus nitritogenes]
MNKAYLSLGSNLGNKKENIENALKYLESESVHIVSVSSYYETEPVGYTDQDWFLNMAIQIETSLNPYELLLYCQEIEQKLKRKRIIRWGPRTIDIDILLYENIYMNDEKLTIPHPRMIERAFVMIPLLEINKDLMIDQKPIKDIVKNMKKEEIRKVCYE